MNRSEKTSSLDLLVRTVEAGGSWEYRVEHRSNFAREGASAHVHRVREHEVKLEARARLGDGAQVFVQLIGLNETRSSRAEERSSRDLERGQMWIQQDRMGGTRWSVQAGRVKLLDSRAWWWEEEVDAIRASHDGGSWRLDAGFARELLRKSSADRGVQADARGVTRFFGHATWPWAPRHAFDAFWLVQHDGSSRPDAGAVFRDEDRLDPSDLHARWLGLRASGEWRAKNGARLAYWADAAWLSGREHVTAFDEHADGTFSAVRASQRRLHGNAFDVGAIGSVGLPLRPSLTVGYARGSAGFRQTGLHENKARFSGGKRWRRYGELVQPELSNLSVVSLGAGLRVFADSSIELMTHRLRQVEAIDHFPGSRLSAKPQGLSRQIGREVNLLLALREHSHVEFTFEASRFKPSAAFAPGNRKAAGAIEVGVSARF